MVTHRKQKDSYFSTSLEKGMNILRLFSRDRSIWNLTEIARSIDINKTSAFRFVNTLVELGYLKKHPKTKAISLGPQVFSLAWVFSQTNTLSEIGTPLIDELSETYRLTIELAVFEEDLLIAVYRRENRDSLVPRLPPTRTLNRLYCTSLGKAVLSHFPPSKLKNTIRKLSLVPRTRYTIVDKSKLIADLRETRERGYALNKEEWILGLTSMAAPILNYRTHKVVGAVSFDFAAHRSSIKVIEEKYAELLLTLSKDISNAFTVQH